MFLSVLNILAMSPAILHSTVNTLMGLDFGVRMYALDGKRHGRMNVGACDSHAVFA